MSELPQSSPEKEDKPTETTDEANQEAEKGNEKEKENEEQKESATDAKKSEEQTSAWKSKWNTFSTQSNEYFSKTRQSLANSMTKLKTNLDHGLPLLRRQSSGPNGHAPLDSKQEITELRERIKKDNEKRKREVIEKSYQSLNKKLYIPSWGASNGDEKQNDQIILDNTESVIPGHTDVVAEFDSIYIGIYSTALEVWAQTMSGKNSFVAKELIFQTIITCYYYMICEKANVLKTHDRVERDNEKYMTFIAFENHCSKSTEDNDGPSSLCQKIVNQIYDDILSAYFNNVEVIKQDSHISSVTKAFIAKCCEVLWCLLCMENDEKTLVLYPLDFRQAQNEESQERKKDVVVEWFEFEHKTDNDQDLYVSFPGVVQINKNNAFPLLLCKAKVFKK